MSRNAIRLGLFLGCLAAGYGCVELTCHLGGTCLSESERETIEQWLLCEECDNELDRVLDDIGWRAIPRLAGALERPPVQNIDRMERQLRVSHRRSGSALPQATYVQVYRANYIARYQKRAAIALGELAARGGIGSDRAREELENALAEHESGQREYRDDALAEIHRAVEKATGQVTWVALVAGAAHSCGLSVSGDAYCWGGNTEGELGDGTNDNRGRPVPIARRITFTSLSAGPGHHTCGVASSTYGYCWGSNEAGQLGDGTRDTRSTPVPVGDGHPLASISVGESHTCADSIEPGILCWGDNAYGQLGVVSIPPLPDTTLPVPLSYATPDGSAPPPLGPVSLGAWHSCALSTDGSGRLYCWGRNGDGQLGDGSTSDRSILIPAQLAGATAVAAGGFHTCALEASGELSCWGRNDHGQLGDGTTTTRTVPTPVSFAGTFTSVTAGASHTCALTAAGTAYCWGNNEAGQLGVGTLVDRSAPVEVAGGHSFASLDAGRAHTCGVTAEGAAYCWGNGQAGQLGDGGFADRSTPVRVSRPPILQP